MPASLLLSATQRAVAAPYQFKLTNIKVYSVEEALYHAYHRWKESLDDIFTREFINWVDESLGLPEIAAKINDISNDGELSERVIKFAGVIDYFDEGELETLYVHLREWENRLEWERYKDRADYLSGAGKPDDALPYYARALKSGVNAALLNNAGVAFMKLNRHAEAIDHLERALSLETDNVQIKKNLAEALIYGSKIDKAEALIAELDKTPDNGGVGYLHGELEYERGDILKAAEYYEEAAAAGGAFYIQRLAEIYVKLRFFDKAVGVMERVAVKDGALLIKQAEIYAACNNVPAAAKCIERALMADKGSAALWIKLARYGRLNYDLNRAEMAVRMALDIESDNEEALLEYARIKKSSGKTRDYQNILNSILQSFKRRYREANAEAAGLGG